MSWDDFISHLNVNNVIHNLEDKPPKCILWGIAPTGDIHIGYLPYVGILNKLRKFGSNVICLIANYHAYLDSKRTDWEKIESRTKHYKGFLRAYNLGDTVIESKDEYIKKSYIEGFLSFLIYFLQNLEEWAGRTLRSYLNKNYKLRDESGIYRFSLSLIENIEY